MGNDSTCSMDGVDTILIKMFNGIMKTLKDVRYVPQMKKNFISIEVLEAHSLEFFW